MSPPFATIDGCTTGGTPPSNDDYQKDVGRILDMLGADETCREEASVETGSTASAFRSKWRSVGAAAGGGAGIAVAGVSVKTGTTQGTSRSSHRNERMLKEGCGAVFANVSEVLESMRRINCTVSQNSTSSSSKVAASASVTIRIEPIDGAYDTLVASRNLTLDILDRTPDTSVNKLAILDRQLLRQTHELDSFGHLHVASSRIEVKAGTQVKQLTSTVQSLVKQVSEDVRTIAKSAATQSLEQEFGAAADTPNVRALVNEEIERRTDEIDTDIAQNVSNSKVDVDSRGNITITSPNRITLADTEISADVSIRLLTSTLTTTAVDVGKQVAQQVLAASMGGLPSSTTSPVVDRLATDLGRPRDDARERDAAASTATGRDAAASATVWAEGIDEDEYYYYAPALLLCVAIVLKAALEPPGRLRTVLRRFAALCVAGGALYAVSNGGRGGRR